jgi:cell division protein FtsI (penicillin-binding protein 3)
MLMVGFLAVFIRAFYLQHLDVDTWKKRAITRYTETQPIPAARGRILDRNGEILAVSTLEYKVGIVPNRFSPTNEQINNFAKLIGKNATDILNKHQNSKKYFYISSGVKPRVKNKIKTLGISGVEFEQIYQRNYPFKEAFSTLIGLTSEKDKGQDGVEFAFDDQLKGVEGLRFIHVERGNVAFDEKILKEPAPGNDVHLSIDAAMQSMVYKNALLAKQKHNAKSVSVVVVDSRNGDILTMVNAPAFDPGDRKNLSLDSIRNRSVTDSFEPGSTFKPFVIAAALDKGLVEPLTTIDTSPGFIKLNGETLRDFKPFGVLSVSDVLAKSSNVGTVRVALKLNPSHMYDYYQTLGFGKSPNLPLGGLAKGRLAPWESWDAVTRATISYGHGVSVSLAQLAQAYTVFARKGDLMPISLLKTNFKRRGIQVFSYESVKSVRSMLERASSSFGTGVKAQVDGFRIAGKTGTAQKAENGGYSKNRYIASFVGIAPIENPRFVIAVMVDEPKGIRTGGQVAAPIFSKIAGDALRRLQMSPDQLNQVLPKTALLK